MSSLPAWLQTSPPTLGLHLDARRVTAVVADRAAGSPVIRAVGSSLLPEGALVPSLTAVNVVQRDECVRAIREAVEQVGGRHRRVALAVPDTAAKVSLLPFEQVPPNVRDADRLVRLQLRKSIPFPVEEAQVAWSAGPETGAGTTLAVVAMRRETVLEYEALCSAAGLQAGTVDIATFNVVNLALLGAGHAGDELLVHVTPAYASIAVVRDGGLIFFRTRAADASEPLPDVVHQTRMYYEDRLAGDGFARVVVVAGPDVADRPRVVGDIASLFDTPVTMLALDGVAAFGDRVQASEALVGQIAAPAGLVLREMEA